VPTQNSYTCQMLRFTIRDVLALTAIAAVSCVAGKVLWAADNLEELAQVIALFIFGAACYILGTRRNRPA
jgi:hypothetical protein